MRQFFCILCDGLILKKEKIFCNFCFLKLKSETIKLRFFKGVPHYYIFSWSRINDQLCRRLAYSLKRKPSSFFIELVSMFHSNIRPLGDKLVVPSSRKMGVDHAKSLAEAFMKLYGGTGVISVKGGGIEPQKRKKTRQERFNSSREVTIESKGDWVFVDDVFVTGATCYKISKRLGARPGLILTLFYKEKEL